MSPRSQPPGHGAKLGKAPTCWAGTAAPAQGHIPPGAGSEPAERDRARRGTRQSMQDVTLRTLTQLLLKHTGPQVLGVPMSHWARGQVHSKGEAREP